MTISDQTFRFVSDLVRRESAIVLDTGKEYLVESRLTPLARAAGTSCVDDYVAALHRRPPAALREVVEALTTNETFWFRDQAPFDALIGTVVPDLLKRGRADRRLRIWSAACSSGQEAYSIAMLMAEHVVPLGWTVEILATDLSTAMLERVDRAEYSQLEVARGLAAPMLVKHFRRSGARWQVAEPLRAMVTTRQVNLARPLPPMPAFDVVFIRNVLIYFDAATKRRILDQVKRVLVPGGYMFLGAAETTLGLDPTWEQVSAGRLTLNRTPGAPLPGRTPATTPLTFSTLNR